MFSFPVAVSNFRGFLAGKDENFSQVRPMPYIESSVPLRNQVFPSLSISGNDAFFRRGNKRVRLS